MINTVFYLLCRGTPVINPSQPYPGTGTECVKTPRIQRILDHFQTAEV